MPLDHYVTLGRSGLRVSPFALGAMTFGEDPGGAGCSVEESEKILGDLPRPRRQLRRHRELLHQRPLREDPRRLASPPSRAGATTSSSPSKFFFNMFPGDPNGGGAGRASIIAQLHESLRRLRTDHLDLYWLHNWDRQHARSRRPCAPSTTWSGPARSATSASPTRRRGSPRRRRPLALLRGWTPLIALQVEYSLLARTVEGELAPLARDAGHGAGAVEPAEERLPLRQVPARRRRSPTRRAPPSSAARATPSTTSSRPSRDRRRARHHLGGGALAWLRARAGHASCRSSARDGSATWRSNLAGLDVDPHRRSSSARSTRCPRRT